MKSSVEQSLIVNKVNFWNPIPKLQIKTFATVVPQKQLKTATEKVIILNADRELFGHLVNSAKPRDVSLKEILTSELSIVPYSLAHSDGTLQKNIKSELLFEKGQKCTCKPSYRQRVNKLPPHTSLMPCHWCRW